MRSGIVIVASVCKMCREDAVSRAKRIHSGLRSVGKREVWRGDEKRRGIGRLRWLL
jgi:hypothetical protein